MYRKYQDCQRADSDCTVCPLARNDQDCRGRPISNLERARKAAGMKLTELSKKSGVGLRQIQRVERGEAEAGNLTARNLLAIADALGIDPKELL